MGFNQLETTTGVLLAGGRSRRMGTNKAKLDVGGMSLLDHCRRILERSGVGNVLISGGDTRDNLPDLMPDKGPLGGIHSAVNSGSGNPSTGFLFITVDMPNLPHDLLADLIEMGQQFEKACIYDNSTLPLYLPNNSTIRSHIEQAIQSKDLSIKGLLKAIGFQSIDWPDSTAFLNVNRPEDWQEFMHHHKAKQGENVHE